MTKLIYAKDCSVKGCSGYFNGKCEWTNILDLISCEGKTQANSTEFVS